MATIPISSICPLSLWERARVRAEPRGSGFRVQSVCKGRANCIANCKLNAIQPIPNPQSPIPNPQSLIPNPSRPAFTLIEVILTLCLLVIISALAWPQLGKTFSNQRLRKAADVVRTQWCKARVEAMRMGSMPRVPL